MRKHREGWGCVYLITNLVNGKRYVGCDTTGKPETNRWKKHIWHACTGVSKGPLHRAMRKAWKIDKHWKSFKFEVIWRGPRKNLLEKEVSYIKKLHTYNADLLGDKSYNLTVGGEGFRGKHSKASRKKMSIGVKRRFEDPAERAKMQDGQLWRYANPAEHEKQRASQILLCKDPAECAKRSAMQLRRYSDPAEHEKTSAGNCRRWSNPAERVHQSIAQTQRYKDPAERMKQSISGKARYAAMTPEAHKVYWHKTHPNGTRKKA